MKQDFLIIPDYKNLAQSLELSEMYGTAFEYNDFFSPLVYCDEDEIEHRIGIYKKLNRDRSKDTVHGVFIDISAASQDPVISEYSQKRMEHSIQIAERLGARGVVFHTGLIDALQFESYIGHWVETQAVFIEKMLSRYSPINIYMENTFENTPSSLIRLKNRLCEQNRFSLCLDYGHACLTSTKVEDWFSQMKGSIGHIHLNDNDLNCDLHLPPGDGTIDLNKFKELYREYADNAPILLEVTGVAAQERALKYMTNL